MITFKTKHCIFCIVNELSVDNILCDSSILDICNVFHKNIQSTHMYVVKITGNCSIKLDRKIVVLRVLGYMYS